MRHWLACSCLIALLGCDACSKEKQVPFKLDETTTKSPTAEAAPLPPTPPTAAPSHALTFPDGTRSIALDGRTLTRSDGSFRAALPADLNGDGTLDALLVTTDAQGRPNLGTAVLQDTQLTLQATALPLVSGPEACQVESVRVSRLAADLALVEWAATCTSTPAPNAPAPTSPAGSRLERCVISVETAPRVLLALGTRNVADSTPLGLTVASVDVDADEHADVRLDITLREAGQDPQRVSLTFMNRPSGLARDTSEPEQTLAQLATAAGQFLPKDPSGARRAASKVLGLHRALCKESGEAELLVDGEAGVSCGPSAAAGRAALTFAIAQTRGRDLFASLDALQALDAPAYKVDAAQRERAHKALALLPGDTSFVWRQGPALQPADAPAVRLPSVAFIDDGQLLLRGSIARSYPIATGEVASVSLPPSVVMSDASGERAAIALTQDCEGMRLRVVPSTQIVGGLVTAAPTGPDDVLVQRPQVPDPTCKPGASAQATGFHVLGHTSSGWLVARGAQLTLVPPAGRGDARAVLPTETLPKLTAAGALSEDGTRYVLATREGVAVVQRGETPKVTLIRTPASCTGAPTDAALSPSGDRVAMICGGHVYYADRSPLPAASPNPTPTPDPVPAPEASPTIPIDQLPPPAPEH
jgi:hypothetical protein